MIAWAAIGGATWTSAAINARDRAALRRPPAPRSGSDASAALVANLGFEEGGYHLRLKNSPPPLFDALVSGLRVHGKRITMHPRWARPGVSCAGSTAWPPLLFRNAAAWLIEWSADMGPSVVAVVESAGAVEQIGAEPVSRPHRAAVGARSGRSRRPFARATGSTRSARSSSQRASSASCWAVKGISATAFARRDRQPGGPQSPGRGWGRSSGPANPSRRSVAELTMNARTGVVVGSRCLLSSASPRRASRCAVTKCVVDETGGPPPRRTPARRSPPGPEAIVGQVDVNRHAVFAGAAGTQASRSSRRPAGWSSCPKRRSRRCRSSAALRRSLCCDLRRWMASAMSSCQLREACTTGPEHSHATRRRVGTDEPTG